MIRNRDAKVKVEKNIRAGLTWTWKMQRRLLSHSISASCAHNKPSSSKFEADSLSKSLFVLGLISLVIFFFIIIFFSFRAGRCRALVVNQSSCRMRRVGATRTHAVFGCMGSVTHRRAGSSMRDSGRRCYRTLASFCRAPQYSTSHAIIVVQ